MPKMRRRNVGTNDRGVDDYLICGKRHNQPRIHHRICEEACRKTKRCIFYKSWYAAAHEEEILKAKEEAKKQKEESKLLKKAAEDPKLLKKAKKETRKRKVKKLKRVKKSKSMEA